MMEETDQASVNGKRGERTTPLPSVSLKLSSGSGSAAVPFQFLQVGGAALDFRSKTA